MNAFNPSAQEATAPLLWTVRYGVVSAIASTHPAVRSLQMYGEWGEAEIDLLSTVIQDGQTVLQFGGEFGAQTLWLARVVGAKGCVHVAQHDRGRNQQGKAERQPKIFGMRGRQHLGAPALSGICRRQQHPYARAGTEDRSQRDDGWEHERHSLGSNRR